jgi:hydrogenase maturation protease
VTEARLAVIGVGNAFRRDDAAGLLVARRLLELPLARDVIVREHEGDMAALLDAWSGCASAVVVDAAFGDSSDEGEAGTVHRFDALAKPLPARMFASTSSHAFGLAEAVELGRALGRLPGALRVYAIEGASFQAGTEVSPAVDSAVDRVVAELAPELGPAPDTA